MEKIHSEEDLASDRLLSGEKYDDNLKDSNPMKIEFSQTLGFQTNDQRKKDTFTEEVPINYPSSPTCFSQDTPESPKKEA